MLSKVFLQYQTRVTGLPSRIQNLSQTPRLLIKWIRGGDPESLHAERTAWDNMGKRMHLNPVLWDLSGITSGCNYMHQLPRTSILPENWRKLPLFIGKTTATQDIWLYIITPKYLNIAQTFAEEGQAPGLIPFSALPDAYLLSFHWSNVHQQQRKQGSLSQCDATTQHSEHSLRCSVHLGLYFALVVTWNMATWELGPHRVMFLTQFLALGLKSLCTRVTS